jgi:hypothetical protein
LVSRCVAALVVTAHNPTMTRRNRSILSTGDFLGVLGIIVGIGALVFDPEWATRAILTLFAIGLVVYAGQRHNSHALVRMPIALAAIWVFSFAPWDQIWDGIRKGHKDLLWPQFIIWPSFHWALACIATVALAWEWYPVSRLRHPLRLWRSVLGDETWIDREEALKLIRGSDWARLREPTYSILETIGQSAFGAGMSPPAKKEIVYRRFIEMTLESFEKYNSGSTKIIGTQKMYPENRLREFMRSALDDEAIKEFGDVPKGTV